jgi:transcriptional repressor NrdR
MCRAPDSRVVDSRLGKDGDAIRRRRHCEGCGHRFTTYERVELALPMVVKKDGRRQAFDRGKIVSGLTRACEKRPVATDTIEALATRIERYFMERGESEVTSREIGEAVMAALHDLDAVAYVRFASVYREFRDVHEFMRELEELIATRNAGGRRAKSVRAARGRTRRPGT